MNQADAMRSDLKNEMERLKIMREEAENDNHVIKQLKDEETERLHYNQ